MEVIERLLGKGFDIQIYDENVRVASLVGANKDYILNHIPHISSLMTDSIEQVLEHAEVIVIGNGSAEFRSIPDQLKEGQQVIDLVRVGPQTSNDHSYQGICW